jgi:predicted nucleic acid-binding protein
VARDEEVTAERALVLDANILLRGVLGTRVRALIERYADRVSLLTPQSCVNEAREYLPILCAKRRWEVAPVLDTLEALLTGIQVIENSALAELEQPAKRRIAERDRDDWPVLALSIAVSAPVWTEDADFFGAGVATWTTRNVEIYLGES